MGQMKSCSCSFNKVNTNSTLMHTPVVDCSQAIRPFAWATGAEELGYCQKITILRMKKRISCICFVESRGERGSSPSLA